ncbi:MAG: transglutaminase domain-containing protein [Polyangiaceae bacterium]
MLLLPKTRTITLREPAGGLFTRSESDEGDLHMIKLLGTNIPALVQEPNMPPLAEKILSASASSFKSWDEVAAWYWGLAKDQLDVDSEVRRVVAEITKGLTDDKDKVRAVYDYVVQKTRYVALEFGIEGYRPRRCAQTLGRGWGDCKDKATLIVTMLRELGIPANLVLVRTNMRGAISSDPPSYALFDHAIAYVPKLDLFLDGTAEYTGMNELPSMDQGALAFIVNEGGTGKLVNLPISAASASARTRRIELALSDAGPAGLDFKIESTGSFASEARQRYHAPSTQRTRLIEDLGSEFGGMSLLPDKQGLETGDLENIEVPASIHLRGKALGIFKSRTGEFSVATAPIGSLVARFASRSERKQDVVLPFPLTLSDEWVVKLPPGQPVKHAPEPVKITSPFGSYELQIESSAGKVVIKTKLTLEKKRVPVENYAEFRAFCEKVDRVLEDRLVVGKLFSQNSTQLFPQRSDKGGQTMSIDRIGKTPGAPPPRYVPGEWGNGPSSSTPVSSVSGSSGVSTTASAEMSPADRVRSGQLSVDAYINLRVDEATKHLASRLGPGDLARVKSMLREQLSTDPALVELVQRATGQTPSEAQG